ncbi:MAG TPA: RsmG family class I SAM-dependent methyltransferase [Thermoanaerobaculia bacterium]|nr:RsmG family class I SAM-dependent methyltransferase [Thermoanaerobaculia bacterium]
MAAKLRRVLPELDVESFRRALASVSPLPLSEPAVAALHLHYRELARWNRLVSLVSPAPPAEIFARHYGESLAALPLVRPSDRRLLDLGSGAGFPGLVLAAALPGCHVTLVEVRQKKVAFLEMVLAKAALPGRVLDVRVALPLPAGLGSDVDLVTSRALRLDADLLAALAERLPPGARFLLWVGEQDPVVPQGWRVEREQPLAGSHHRRILEIGRL